MSESRFKMRQLFSARWKVPAGLFVLAALLFGSFQNCSDPMMTESGGSSLNDSLPFAFDTKVDHLAYMSCDGIDDEPASHFTFRVTASDAGSGIRLTDEFRTAVGSGSSTRLANAIANSTQNIGAFLQFSIRQKGNYQSLWTGRQGREFFDYSKMLGTLDSEAIANQLAQTAQQVSPANGNERVRYFSGIPGIDSGRRIEGSLRFWDSHSLAQSTREALQNNYLLTITYGDIDGADERIARGITYGNSEEVYGTGYELTFSQGPALDKDFTDNAAIAGQQADPDAATGGRAPDAFYANAGNQTLSSVTEVDLMTGRTVASSWDCPTELKFVIVRPEDISTSTGPGRIFCAETVENPNDNDPVLQALRSVLPVGDWNIDLTARCVYPRYNGTQTGDSCYKSIEDIVNYSGQDGPDGTNGTYADPTLCGYDNSGSPILRNLLLNGSNRLVHVVCPKYVSVCVRQ